MYDICTPQAMRYILLGFFFFQAEDGIRDVAVTGVQTCALPISRYVHERQELLFNDGAPLSSEPVRRNPRWSHCQEQALRLLLLPRSEERRVGKECRSRWSPYH